MQVLLIGSGGQEHALAWKIAQSPLCEKLYIAPGNAGTAEEGENVPLKPTDIAGLLKFAKEKGIDFSVVGMDDPLALGVVDEFQAAGLKIFGPTKRADEIESSKVFAKEFMARHGIPTARFQTFSSFESALAFAKELSDSEQNGKVVVKASGLALGKGAFVCRNLSEAETALRQIMVAKIFGPAGAAVVVEEFLEGPEVSIHALSDGKTYRLFPTAQDHKTIFENDTGPMTGGVGMIAPVPQFESREFMAQVEQTIVRPALEGLAKEGRVYQGLLYPGLIITAQGPKVLEFNARFGDPEPQSYLRLLKSDLLTVLHACATGTLDQINLEWTPGYAACVVLCSGGYPGEYKKGLPITGIEEAENLPVDGEGIKVFHAGTTMVDGQLVTNGGRVLGVTAVGDNLALALEKAYAAARKIHFEGMYYRRDIGRKSLA